MWIAKILVPALCLSLAAPVVLFAEQAQTEFKLVGAGPNKHSVWGEGIVMTILPEPMPEDGLMGDTVKQSMLPVCQHFAPQVIPYVMNAGEIDSPEYIGVRVVNTTKRVGSYYMQVYKIVDGTCGDPIPRK